MLTALFLLLAPRAPVHLVVEGFRPTSEAVVGTAAMKYLPFDVPKGVTKISVTPILDDGPDPSVRNTVDLGLFDARGPQNGFRGWEGGTRKPFDVTGSRSTTSPPFLPGAIPSGKWYLAQYYLKASPAGLKYRYEVTLWFDGPPATRVTIPPYRPAARRNASGWYAGNLHCHSKVSDGGLPFSELVRKVRDTGFDFMVSTEHNTPAAHYDFAAASLPGFLMIEGNELTMPSGHAGVIGQKPGDWYDFRTQAGDGGLPARIAKAHRQGAIFVINHPFALCTTCTWSYLPDEWKGADGVEVWNGTWDPTDEQALRWWDRALRAGEHLNAYGGTDFHRGDDLLSPACFVRADELSRRAIMDGLRHGRTSLSESPRGPRLELTVDSAEIGDSVAPNPEASVRCSVIGARQRVTLILIGSHGPIDRTGVRDGVISKRVDTRGLRFVRAELRNPNGSMAALTNAVFVKEQGG